jgi:hypothetical protein
MRPKLAPRFLALPALLLCSAPVSFGQEPPRFKLEVEKEFPVAGIAAGPTQEPIKCDSRGNMYVRFYDSRPFSAPLLKISPEGERKAAFTLERVPQWEKGEFIDFEIDANGHVYLLVVKPTKNRTLSYAIVAMNEEARFQFTAELNLPFRLDSVDHLAIFPSGQFLVGGFRSLGEAKGQALPSGTGDPKVTTEVEPILVVVDRAGRLVSEVSFSPNTLETPREASRKGVMPASAIHGESILPWEDGYLYVLYRTTGPPSLYAISSDGRVARTVKVVPPTENATAIDIVGAPGAGILVHFGEGDARGYYAADKMLFSIVNPTSGERIYDYSTNRQLGGALGCYHRGTFTFLGNVKGQFAVLRAKPH